MAKSMRLSGKFSMTGTSVERKFFLRALFIGMISASLLTSPSPALGIDGPNSSTITVYSRILDEPRTISVSLPEGYETATKKYPVLYVLDAEGDRLFTNGVSTLKHLNEKNIAPPMIVVGIWNTDRNRDMIPVAVSHRPGSGGAKNFLAFIDRELKPHIQREYRASDSAILYGMSNSALFAVYALLEIPEAFDGVIASSPMIGHCPEFIEQKSETFVLKNLKKPLVLFMIYGSEDSKRVIDYVPGFQEYMNMHAPTGFGSRMVILEGEGHVPASSLASGLEFIFNRYPDAISSWAVSHALF
jgi:predicted alpha/beta superfamily hydrolase